MNGNTIHNPTCPGPLDVPDGMKMFVSVRVSYDADTVIDRNIAINVVSVTKAPDVLENIAHVLSFDDLFCKNTRSRLNRIVSVA